MSGFNYTFDATQYAPEQGSPTHPIGKFPAYISGTSIQPTKDNDGGMFVVEYTTEQGKISHRFNLWNQNQKAVDIAHKQLSALCHAVGVFRVDMNNEGAALRNGRLMIEVGQQKNDPQYTEVKKVFDMNGNEPGKAGQGAAPAQPQQAAAGFGQQPQGQGGFGQQPQQQPAQGGAWGGQPQGQQQPAQQQPAQGGAAWGQQPQQQPQQPQGNGAAWGGQQPQQNAAPQGGQPGGWQQQPQGGAPAGGAAPWGAR